MQKSIARSDAKDQVDRCRILAGRPEPSPPPAFSTNLSMTSQLPPLPPPPAPLDEPRPARKSPRRSLPGWAKIAGLFLGVMLLFPVGSLGKALVAANNLTMAERTAEWMRDNDLGGVLNRVEAFWFSRKQPKAGGDPARAIEVIEIGETEIADPGPTIVPHLPKPANVPVPAGVTPVQNEGIWMPVGPTVGGAQAMYTTQVRPDSIHTSILDGLVWMDPKLLRFQVHPGTQEPGGKWAFPSQVPMADRLSLLAAFNGGFRMQDALGGFYLDGVTHTPLRDGAASLVVYKDGGATVGKWGRDFTMSPEIESVRQNLDLIVDNGGGLPKPGGNLPSAGTANPGVPVEGLDNNANGAWGDTLGNKVLVWRSAVCVTGDGALVYGYGSGLGARSLADLLLRAGCVRAMELDINPAWTTFNFYAPAAFNDPASVKGTKLLPESEKSGNRYLSNDSRDFVAVFTRPL